MPLNKLDNFIKNTEGRILYVNPSDLDSTDSITNEGNSLAQPFKTIQRALIEAARFSYLKGTNNDVVEKTTILLFPGEHIVDNRPGYAIYNYTGGGSNVAYVTPVEGGTGTSATTTLNLELDSNFDLTQEDNILYKFNSVYGGVVVPRGTSLVGLDLRKTKIRPRYVPNPTDPNAPSSAIFRITGACYFWQFSIFDGSTTSEVYTNPRTFTEQYKSIPTFSHHKLTCFEFCDGLNDVNRIRFGELTDLDMYYHKVGNAYNSYREIENLSKFPSSSTSFAKRSPEWEIVGPFKTDAITISNVISGNGTTPSKRVTITTAKAHKLNSGTPIRIRGIGRTISDDQLLTDSSTYNVSTLVQDVISETKFTYLLETLPINLSASPELQDNPTVTVEVDTVDGASPYIFNCSLRSVWGMNGLHADGSKADGFRSIVTAQFTGVSLQKDDRAFVKYNEKTRTYDSLAYQTVHGGELSAQSSSASSNKVYHLDQDALYGPLWETSHLKISNDSFIQIVSVFAIGYTYHFNMLSGADASITNSNSNFGQFALKSEGFKVTSFEKDDHGYVTGIIAPRSIDDSIVDEIEWLSLDVKKTREVANAGTDGKLYIYGFTSESATPISLTQGYRVGAKQNDILYLRHEGIEYSAPIYMMGNGVLNNSHKINRNEKSYTVTNIIKSGGSSGDSGKDTNQFLIGTNNLSTGERVIITSKSGDLPENIVEHQVYYAITHATDQKTSTNQDGLLSDEYIKLAASYTYAFLGEGIKAYGGIKNNDLIINSRVSDKNANDIGSPLEWDSVQGQWYINVGSGSEIYNSFLDSGIGYDPTGADDKKYADSTDLAFVKRIADERGLDEKTYKLRVVIPKEVTNGKNPEIGFILQDSSSVAPLTDNDIPFRVGSRDVLKLTDTKYNRNSRFIKTAERVGTEFLYTTERPHGLKVNDVVIIRNIKDNVKATEAQFNRGFNGSFVVYSINNEYEFMVSEKDIAGLTHAPGTIISFNRSVASEIPTFSRNDLKSNFYIYRNDVISDYVQNEKDGIYHLYVLNASNIVPGLFSDLNYSQTPVDLYPQLDRDNLDSNPSSSTTFAKRSPLGDVSTNNLKNSITRETLDLFCKDFNVGLKINDISNPTTTTPTLTFTLPHGLGGAVGGTLTGGSDHTDGTYYNVKLFNDSNQSPSLWKGATGRVIVDSGIVTEILIQEGGSGQSDGDKLYPDISVIGGSSDAELLLSTTTPNLGISTSIGDVIQLTGDSNTEDSYYRISSVGEKTIGFGRTSGDPTITNKQYAFIIGPSTKISGITTGVSETIIDGESTISVGVVTFTTTQSHGLSRGNSFRVIDASNNNVGDYIVQDKLSPTTLNVRIETSKLTSSGIGNGVDNGYILKQGMSSNEGISDIRTESYASRGISFYDGECLKLTADYETNSTGTLTFSCLTGDYVSNRIQLGDYLQINDEIFRVSGNVDTTTAVVSRGYFGTRQGDHKTGDLVKKIKAIPIEFRRPSICRASAHTFEYIGYGPGNYSTALPQVQIKTLTDREDFLAQAQERSAGAVVYTGMNNKGDTFNGNSKLSASSGETISYDIPKPTITGQDPSKLSVVFDEVTVRERILVEGGTSGYVLSQFDGPVTMTRQLRVKRKATFNGQVRITFKKDATNENTGSLVVKGGIGVGGHSFISGKLNVTGEIQTGAGLIPTLDFGSYLGKATRRFEEAYIGDIKVGVANSFTAESTTGDFTIKSVGDVNIDPGIGKSVRISKRVEIQGDLEVKAPGSSVPPGQDSGTIRANYLEVPNVTPIGSVVVWAGKDSNLPTGTVNGSIVTMWHVCDGEKLNTYTYRALHKVISDTYGGAEYIEGITDQSGAETTFEIPNLTNQFLIGSSSDTGTNITGAEYPLRSGGHKNAVLISHDHTGETGQDGQHNHTGGTDSDGQHGHTPISASSEDAGKHGHQGSSAITNTTGIQIVADGSHAHQGGATGQARSLEPTQRYQPNKEFFRPGDTLLNGAHGHGITDLGHHHQLQITEKGSHSHPVSVSITSHGGHTHGIPSHSGHTHDIQYAGKSATDESVSNTENVSGDLGVSKNLPPYFALYYIMRTL